MKVVLVLLIIVVIGGIVAFIVSSCINQQVKLIKPATKRGPNYPKYLGDGKYLFRISVPEEVQVVSIAGTFNNWDEKATVLSNEGNGNWSIVLELPRNSVVKYKYVIDGYWVPDPDNPDVEEDGQNSWNSILKTK